MLGPVKILEVAEGNDARFLPIGVEIFVFLDHKEDHGWDDFW